MLAAVPLAWAPGARVGPYVILSLLRASGMGEVYRARDSRLARDVAIKVLPAAVVRDADRLRRFEQEARAAGQINHPNIVVVYDVGTHEGAPYLVTELLQGETLRERLARQRLSVSEAVALSLQIARGLSAAHEQGIVHRDVKPDNVFVGPNGQAKILDFGLAKLTRPEVGGEESPTRIRDTEPGTVMGSVGYMSPEQVRGQAADHRSDIFSFGAILFEMLWGTRAFSRATPAETMTAILNEEPPEQASSAVPSSLETVVRRCLRKRPEERFQLARDLVSEIEAIPSAPDRNTAPASARPSTRIRIGLVLAVASALALTLVSVRRIDHSTPAAASLPSGVKLLAVLPFENLGAPSDAYFADGMTDAVRGKLATLSGLQVTARTSSNQYKKTTKMPRQIARELGVEYLLTATVRWEKQESGESRVSVSPELVEAATGATKWQQSFEAMLANVFEVQAQIAGQVAQALDLALGQRDRTRLEERLTSNLAAYDAYLQGNEVAGGFVSIGAADVRRTIDPYERAVALDPNFALAWAQLSRARSRLYFNGIPSSENLERARAAAERALALAPGLPAGHVALGDYYGSVLKDWPRAAREYAIGCEEAPRDADLLSGAAVAQSSAGRWQEALASLRKAQALDPRSAVTARRLADALLMLRRYPSAREAADRGLALAPQSISLFSLKVMTFLGQGDLEGARAAVRAAPREISATVLVAQLAEYSDLFWVLDEEQQALLLRLTPEAFDEDRLVWGLALAQTASLRGDLPTARKYAEAARSAAEAQLRDAHQDGQRHVLLGLALAYLGRRTEAVREGERGVALLPVAKDANIGAYLQHQLARIYLRVGQPEKALDVLGGLLKIPYYVSPRWLLIDPEFAPIRNHPRFRKLVLT